MNFSWVLDNELGGSQGPAGMRDLFYLYQQGVRAMIRMEERTIPADGGGMLDIVDMFEPVPDFTPPTQEQIDRMLGFINEQNDAGRPVAVSCYAGIGRTGTVLACHLVSKGAWPGDAVDEVRPAASGFDTDAGAGGCCLRVRPSGGAWGRPHPNPLPEGRTIAK